MELEQEERPLQVEITDEAHIADVVDGLGNETHALTVTLDHSATAFPVTLSQVDPERRRMTLSLVDAQSLSEPEIAESNLVLRAESVADTLHFEALETLEVTRNGDCLEIQCRLPRTLYTTSKRRSVRIPFVQGMYAKAHATVLPNQPPLAGKLRNLSSGGCLMEIPLSKVPFFHIGEPLPTVRFEFPNGERFAAAGIIRHIKPAGRSHYAAVGIAFFNLSSEQKNRLIHYVTEAEHEAAYRSGYGGRMARPSPLFRSSQRERQRQGHGQRSLAESTPMVRAVREVARQLHIALLAIQTQQPVSGEALYECADTLLHLLERQRQQFLYALACLGDEPQWIQHSVNVAGKLGDLMLAEPKHAPQARDAVVAALLHDMGKAMLLSQELNSLEGQLNERQRNLLRRHVEVLLEHLQQADWLDNRVRHDIIGCINERLDGSGYPMTRLGEALSPVARMAAVIDVIDAMMRPRGDRPAKTAIEAYRYLYNRPERFDKWWVTRYVQRHGFYPIGSLVKFSRGYLAWVMELDDGGQPTRVRVVRNTSRSELAINNILTRADFDQLGQLESLVRPEQYQLVPF
ncbi:HD domain-containing phosphohydrolase [Halomonas sp. WWR20]